jgi:Tfp pilus assembly protein PilF
MRANDVEALTYKADALLDIDEDSWALSLIDQALEHDKEYGLAYWQRACARAKLGQPSEAIEDINRAIELSAPLKNEVAEEAYFKDLRDHPEFQALIGDE